MDLLRETTELRRLQKLESDMAKQTPDLKVPLLSVRARAAGYGDELDAYERAKDIGHRAREILVTRNMGLVYFVVNDVWAKQGAALKTPTLSKEDLVQEGAIGLARAVDKYNIGIGGKFSTYAVYWIRAAVLRGIAERDDVMRVPEHVSSAMTKMTRAAQRLGLDIDGTELLNSVFSNGDDRWKEASTAKALAEEAGLTNFQLREAIKVRRRRKGGYIAYEPWMTEAKPLEVVGTDSGFSTASLSDELIDSEALKERISIFLQPKELEALSLRYGLKEAANVASSSQASQAVTSAKLRKQDKANAAVVTASKAVAASEAKSGTERRQPEKGRWGEAMSFKEVGTSMSISAEYGRRLCHKALDKLRQAVDDGRLEPALLL